LETFFRNVPAHNVLCIRVEHRAGRKDLRALGRLICAGDNHSRSAITEETRRNQVCRREILPLHRERAKFDREQSGILSRIGKRVICGACNSGRSRYKTEPEDRNPLDVGRQSHSIDQARIQ